MPTKCKHTYFVDVFTFPVWRVLPCWQSSVWEKTLCSVSLAALRTINVLWVSKEYISFHSWNWRSPRTLHLKRTFPASEQITLFWNPASMKSSLVIKSLLNLSTSSMILVASHQSNNQNQSRCNHLYQYGLGNDCLQTKSRARRTAPPAALWKQLANQLRSAPSLTSWPTSRQRLVQYDWRSEGVYTVCKCAAGAGKKCRLVDNIRARLGSEANFGSHEIKISS